MRRQHTIFYFLIFLTVFIIQALSPVGQSSDSRYFLHIADALTHGDGLSLDNYQRAVNLDPLLSYSVTTINGHLYSIYPPALPILISPLVALINVFSGDALHHILLYAVPVGIEIYLASLIVALTCVVLLAVLHHWLSMRQAIGVTLVFAFGTAVWSTASRALWQQGPSMLLLSCALLCLVSKRRVAVAGLFLGLATAVRPTNLLSVAAAVVYLAVVNRQALVGFCVLAVIAYAPFALISVAIYGSLNTPNYVNLSALIPGKTYLEALVGNLISPSRGLLLFSPVLLFSLWGSFIWIHERNPLGIALSVVVVLHWLIMSAWPQWWAGWAYGSRYLCDMLPYLAVLTVPAVQRLKTFRLRTALAFLALVSFLISAHGALDDATWLWNGTPANVDKVPARLWDWIDPQFLR